MAKYDDKRIVDVDLSTRPRADADGFLGLSWYPEQKREGQFEIVYPGIQTEGLTVPDADGWVAITGYRQDDIHILFYDGTVVATQAMSCCPEAVSVREDGKVAFCTANAGRGILTYDHANKTVSQDWESTIDFGRAEYCCFDDKGNWYHGNDGGNERMLEKWDVETQTRLADYVYSDIVRVSSVAYAFGYVWCLYEGDDTPVGTNEAALVLFDEDLNWRWRIWLGVGVGDKSNARHHNTAIKVTPNGFCIAVTSGTGKIFCYRPNKTKVWEFDTGLAGHQDVDVDPNGDFYVVSEDDGKVQKYTDGLDAGIPQLIWEHDYHLGEQGYEMRDPTCLSSDLNNYVYIGHYDGGLSILNSKDGSVFRQDQNWFPSNDLNPEEAYRVSAHPGPLGQHFGSIAPVNVKASNRNKAAKLTWQELVSSDKVAGYDVYVDGTKDNDSIITGTSYTVTELNNLQQYEFEVVAIFPDGGQEKPRYAWATPNYLTNNLLSYYTFDPGEFLTDRAGSNNLSNNGASQISSPAIHGDSVYFQYYYHRIEGPTDLHFTGDFTIAFWFRPRDLTVTDAQHLIARFDNCANKEEWRIWLNHYSSEPPPLSFEISEQPDGSVSKNINTSNTAEKDKWNFAVAWYDSVNDTLYVQLSNGTVASGNIGSPAQTDVKMTLGSILYCGGDESQGYQDGFIDECGIWERQLSSDERDFLFNSREGRTYEDFGF